MGQMKNLSIDLDELAAKLSNPAEDTEMQLKLNREKVQQLAEFWKEVDRGGLPEVKSDAADRWAPIQTGPHLRSNMSHFRISPPLIPVDFQRMLTSGIDCEFSDSSESGNYAIGPLKKLEATNSTYKYRSRTHSWVYCKPRESYWHSWNPTKKSECPVPDGIRVEIRCRDADSSIKIATMFQWHTLEHYKEAEIIAFKVLGLAKGYCWPWEAENND